MLAAPRPRQALAAPRPGRRERHRAQTRERLFRAALRLFAERGFVGTKVEDITEAADVAKGTFFNYFPSKAHVLAAFGEMQVGKVEAALADPAADRRPASEVMRGMVRALAEEPGRSPALVRAMIVGILSSAPVRRLMLRNLLRGRQALGGFFASRQQRGEVHPALPDPSALARAMQQMFFGTLVLWAIDPSETLNARLDEALHLFWSGVSAKRPPRTFTVRGPRARLGRAGQGVNG